MSETESKFRPVYGDPEATLCDELQDLGEIVQDAEDSIGWDISFGARLNFDDDLQFDDGRGLHVHLAIGPDFRAGSAIRTVTPAQLRALAEQLLGLARRAEDRAKAEVAR